MREVRFRSAFDDITFEWCMEKFHSIPQDSLDGIGVPFGDKFVKLIRLDSEETPPMDKKRGTYTRHDFQKEYEHAKMGNMLAIGPEVYGAFVVSRLHQHEDVETQHVKVVRREEIGCILFEKLENSLENLMTGREAWLDKRDAVFKLFSPKRNWASDASDTLIKSPAPTSPRTPAQNCAQSPRQTPPQTPAMNQYLASLETWLRNCIDIMKQRNFYHMDMHPGNIFYKRRYGELQWYLIDYGRVVHAPGGINEDTRLQKYIPRAIATRIFEDANELLEYSMRNLKQNLCNLADNDSNVKWAAFLSHLGTLTRPTTPPTPTKSEPGELLTP